MPTTSCQGLERRLLFAADFVLDRNAVAIQAIADDHTPPVVASPEQGGPTRTAYAMAIVHASMFDALNSIGGTYEPYLVDLDAPGWASRGAAVAQAAHDTLAALYPSQASVFDDALADSLGQLADKKAKQAGIPIGRFVADAILDARADDGADATMTYDEPVVPGVFQMFPGEP